MLNGPDGIPRAQHPGPAITELLSGFSKLNFYKHETILVAVSGGSDSMALLHLAHAFCAEHFPDTRLIAVTINHGLRIEAAAEVRQVGKWCDALGVEHKSALWDGEKPKTAIQSAARHARQRLILDIAAASGATLVLVGHSGDDQAETVAMRHARSGQDNGTHGLAGIAPATLMDKHVWFARPLLGLGRQRLRKFLSERSLGWIEDPSNDDQQFERVRIRAQLDAFSRSRWLQCAATASAARTSLAADAADLVRRGAIFRLDDWPQRFVLDRHKVMQSPLVEVESAMRMVLQYFTRDEFPPSQGSLRDITDFAVNARTGEKKTICKCVLTARRDTIMVVHDPRAGDRKVKGGHRVSSFDWPLANALERSIWHRELPRPPFV